MDIHSTRAPMHARDGLHASTPAIGNDVGKPFARQGQNGAYDLRTLPSPDKGLCRHPGLDGPAEKLLQHANTNDPVPGDGTLEFVERPDPVRHGDRRRVGRKSKTNYTSRSSRGRPTSGSSARATSSTSPRSSSMRPPTSAGGATSPFASIGTRPYCPSTSPRTSPSASMTGGPSSFP